MIKKIFFAFALASLMESRCLEGCLRCSPENKCLYCDVLNGYQLRSGRCMRPEIPNCVVTNDKAQCLRCESGFYLDTSVNQCFELIPQTVVENCDYHQQPSVCAHCKKGFYLKNGACFQISSPIADCRTENQRGFCQECEVGFVRSVDKKSCVSKPEISACATFSHVTCRECLPTHIMNENFYLDLLYKFKSSRDLQNLSQMRENTQKGIVDSQKFTTCQLKDVSNCVVFDTFSRCRKCSPGYFVNSKKQCEENPKQTISNCIIYSSLTSCISCAQGYRLREGKCTPVFNIENCLLYRTDVEATICTRCHNDYYLSAENLCTKRTDLSRIDLCERLAYNFEKCEQCLRGYIPTSDGFRCLAEIKNCQAYEFSNTNTIQLSCATCKPGFYYNLSNRVCIKGSVEFCRIYEREKDECIQCQPKFYLIDNKCEPQKQLQFCQKYSASHANTCVQCDSNNFLFSRVKSCQKVDRIPHCEVYLSKTACSKCRDGYRLLEPSQCVQIPLHENCLQKVGEECVKCLPHFGLMGGVCLPAYNYISAGCQRSNMDGKTPFEKLRCESCQENFVPLNMRNTFVCLEKKTMHYQMNYGKNKSFDEDCEQYHFYGDFEYNCVRCRPGRVLVDGICKENCYQPGKLTLYKQWVTLHNVTGDLQNDAFQVQYVNICQKTIPNCSVASLDISQNFKTIKYSCEKCEEGYLPVIGIPEYGQIASQQDPSQMREHYRMPVTSLPGVQCKKVKDIKVLGHLNKRNMVDQCDFYSVIQKDVFGCRKCRHGLTGKVIQIIKNCQVYKDWNRCEKCDPNHYLSNKQECRPVLKIEKCVAYDVKADRPKCVNCEKNFFLQGEKCVPRELSLEKQHCKLIEDQDQCLCDPGYVMNPSIHVCYKKPDFCENSSVVNEEVHCSTCEREKSYREGVICKIGTVPHCEKYFETENKCEKCKNGFYLSNSICKPHTPNLDQFCDLWDIQNKNVCKRCKPEATKFIRENECRPVVEQIPNCMQYTDVFSCNKCDPGYYLNNVSKRCLVIPAESNCLEMKVMELKHAALFDKNDYTDRIRFLHTCDKCKPNFYRRQFSVKENYFTDPNLNTEQLNVFKCVDWLNYHTENCQFTDIKGVENFGKFCFGCNQQALPFSLLDKYTCVNKYYLHERKNALLLDSYTNCAAVEYKANRSMVCTECKNGYFINPANNECITASTCNQAGSCPYKFFVDSYRVKKNICATCTSGAQITGCLEYVNVIKKNLLVYSVDDSCVKCDSTNDYLLINKAITTGVTTASVLEWSLYNTLEFTASVDHFNETYQAMTCVQDTNLTNLKGIVVNKEVPNCAFYGTDGTSFGCFRCRQGYHGRVQDDTTFGFLEACEKMNSCVQESLGGLSLNSVWKEQFAPLTTFFSCQKCSQSNQIPVAFLHFNGGTDFQPTGNAVGVIHRVFETSFTKDGTNKMVAPTDGTTLLTYALQKGTQYQTICYDETKVAQANNQDTDNLANITGTYTYPSNCGLAIINTNSAANNGYCVACKEGYYISGYDGTTTWAVNSCTAITNCSASNKALNMCDSCVWHYDVVSQKINSLADMNANCVQQKGSSKCFAGVVVSGTLTCYICDVGYELNSQNQCIKVPIPQCKAPNLTNKVPENNLLFIDRWFMIGKHLTELHLAGCSQCEDPNYILYKVVNNSVDDLISPTFCGLVQNEAGSNDSALRTTWINNSADLKTIQNCKNYGYKEGKFVCVECQANFYLVTKDSICMPVTTLITDLVPNCLIVSSKSSTDCQVCKTGYVNVGGLCRPDSGNSYIDPNCDKYAEATKSSYQSICAKCKTGFYAKMTISPFNKCTPIPSTETNCIDYLDETGCVRCEDGFGLMLIRILHSQDRTKRICSKLDFTNDGVGQFDYDPNCTELNVISTQNSLNQQRLLCRKCKSHTVLQASGLGYKQKCYPVVPLVDECKRYNSPDLDLDIETSEPQVIKTKDFRCIECKNEKTHFLDTVQDVCSIRNNTTNCENFDKYADRCKKCEDGYYLSFDRTQCVPFRSNKTEGYLDVCRSIPKCDQNAWYEGLDSQMNSIYSCHQCLDTREIPFVIGQLQLSSEVRGFELFHSMKQFDDNFIPYRNEQSFPESSFVQCMRPVQESFSMTTNFSFPQNCGLGFVNLEPLMQSGNHDASHSSGDSNFSRDKTTVRCAACKPGFRALRQMIQVGDKKDYLGFLAIGCTEIENCERSTWFNSCTQCRAGFAHSYDMRKGVQFDTCVQVPERHKSCHAFDQGSNRCIFCKRGSYLNRDFVCELVNPPNCEAGAFRFNDFFTQVDLSHGLYVSPEFVGCNRCSEGFVGALSNEDIHVCVSSMYHVREDMDTETFYVKNCLEYGIDYPKPEFEEQPAIYKCRRCKEGFVLSEENKCHSQTGLQNCEMSINANLCGKCQKGFVLVNRQCQAAAIANCALYGNEVQEKDCEFCGRNEQICVQCEKEYYLRVNECVKGEVRNCEVLETETICKKCEPGFTLILSSNGKSYCYPNDPRFNCLEFDPQLLQAQTLSCKKCKDSTFILSKSQTDRPHLSCMPFRHIDNCVQYNNNPIAIADSSFQCIKCNKTSYLSGEVCVERTAMPDECKSFDPYSDSCLVCQTGYFRSSDGKSCTAYPQGIQGCENYMNKNTCMKCAVGYYLKDKVCNLVQQEVPNCLYYQDDGICEVCGDSYINLKGTCFQTLAQNCLTYENINACKTCQEGFNLKEENGVVSCVQTTITNCIRVDEYAPYNCLECSGNFYPNEQECVAVTTLIPDCVQYSSASTCSKCASTTVLSVDQSACMKSPELMNHVDLNCLDSVMNEKPVCNTCQPGYTFLFGECVACPSDSIEKGCYTCDPYNKYRCLMCASGWIQSPEGKCLKPIKESSGLDDIGRSLQELDLDDTLMRRLQ